MRACGKIEKQKHILSLSLELVKAVVPVFSTHVMAYGTFSSSFTQPSVDMSLTCEQTERQREAQILYHGILVLE